MRSLPTHRPAAAICAALLLGACGTEDPSPIDGTWRAVHAERQGRYHNDPVDGRLTMVFREGEVRSWFGRGERKEQRGTFEARGGTLNVLLRIRGAEHATKAIYKLEGDELVLCMGDDDRPKDFQTKDTPFTLLRLRRR